MNRTRAKHLSIRNRIEYNETVSQSKSRLPEPFARQEKQPFARADGKGLTEYRPEHVCSPDTLGFSLLVPDEG